MVYPGRADGWLMVYNGYSSSLIVGSLHQPSMNPAHPPTSTNIHHYQATNINWSSTQNPRFLKPWWYTAPRLQFRGGKWPPAAVGPEHGRPWGRPAANDSAASHQGVTRPGAKKVGRWNSGGFHGWFLVNLSIYIHLFHGLSMSIHKLGKIEDVKPPASYCLLLPRS